MTGLNMYLPPPSVTGVAIPGGLVVEDKSSQNYQRILQIRREAQEAIERENKKYEHKDKHKTPVGIKAIGAALAVTFAALGVKRLFKK